MLNTAEQTHKRLRHLQRFDDNALLFFVVSYLGVPSHWEIFAKRMSIKSVIRHYPPQVRVSNEEDSEKIVHLSFIPIRTVVEAANAWDGGRLVSVGFDSYPAVVANAEQVVHHLESIRSGRVVDRSYV